MMTDRKFLSRRHFGKLAFGAAAAARVSQAEEIPTLRVLCYNIHYGQGNDGVYDIPRLAEVIKASNPDLVALQEIDVHVERSARLHELRILANETGMAGRFGPTQHYQGGLFGNGILSKLPIHDVHIEPLPYTEATPKLVTYPRAAVAAIVEMKNGRKLRFMSTHFQHSKFEEDRLAEAAAINSRFATDDPADDVMGPDAAALPTILAGDLNAVPDSAPMRELRKKWTVAIEEDPAPTAPSKAPRNRIDYILCRSSDGIRIVEHSVITEPMASDHCPVFAVLELPAG